MALRLDDVDLVRDRALVEQFQAGDVSGFEDLYRRYYGRLYRFCLKRVGDPLEAEELTQESFVRAFRALSGFAGERRFYPWLSVIAARLCVDNHRRKSRTEPSAEVDLGVTDGGQDRIIDAVDIDLLNQALARLGPRHREVLRLREEEGWSYQHIASHYDVSLGTVEALLWRARRALRREFIAVAGPESTGAAAGIPLLGWLVRRMHGLRTRLGQWTDTALPAVANGAISMAVVVGSSAGVSALIHEGTAAVAASGRNPIVHLANNGPAVTATGPAASSQAASAPAVHVTSPAHAAAPLNTPSAVQPFARVNNSQQGQEEINSQKYHLDLGIVAIGANPSSIVPNLLDGVKRTIAP